MVLIDANVILRYILNDNPAMSVKAQETIAIGTFTTPEVLAEVVYVLNSVYKAEKKEIADYLSSVLADVHIDKPEIYLKALEIYSEKNLDFVDCILIARHQILGDKVLSFDKKLNKYL